MPARRDPDELLTRTDLRRLLKVGRDVLRLMEEAGELPEPSLWLRSQPRWLWADVRRWLRRGAPNGRSPPESDRKRRSVPRPPEGH